MRSERIAALSRYVMIDMLNPAVTAATQWFERTLDDSANKRLSVPEAFLAVDGILDLYMNVVDGLVVYPKVIEQRLMSELPFMATENIMMDAVKRGGDRQELHERIREHSMDAGRRVKVEGKPNDAAGTHCCRSGLRNNDGRTSGDYESEEFCGPRTGTGIRVSQRSGRTDSSGEPGGSGNDLEINV